MKLSPIFIAGPSGVGKNAVIRRLLESSSDLEKLKTTTSRPRRSDDTGNEYFFVREEEFEQMIERGEVSEWAQIHGAYYGSRQRDLLDIIDKGKRPIAALNLAGIKSYKKIFPNALSIFITYESLAKLPDRIRLNRPDLSEEEIKRRLHTAQKEMETVDQYDYVVINREGELDQTVEEITKIIDKTNRE